MKNYGKSHSSRMKKLRYGIEQPRGYNCMRKKMHVKKSQITESEISCSRHGT
jgi:hypothetical protein